MNFGDKPVFDMIATSFLQPLLFTSATGKSNQFTPTGRTTP